MTAAELYRHTLDALRAIPGFEREADATARILMEDLAGYDRKALFVNGDRTVLPETAGRVARAVERVAAGQPVQYVVGTARFMGLDFAVTPDVLIPRPETAALVDMITDQWRRSSDLSVLDIGTGSGCIAVSLARALPFARIDAVDVSEKALQVAEGNAMRNSVKVDFKKEDILNAVAPEAPVYDVIVSNPPYICRSERAGMDARVYDHEPALALFVPDNDALIFYRSIAVYARAALKRGGRLYFEINSKYSGEIVSMLERYGYTDVAAFRDFRGLYRYVSACRGDD